VLSVIVFDGGGLVDDDGLRQAMFADDFIQETFCGRAVPFRKNPPLPNDDDTIMVTRLP